MEGIKDDSSKVALSKAIIMRRPRAAANSFSTIVSMRWINASRPIDLQIAARAVTIRFTAIIKKEQTNIDVQQKENRLESSDTLPSLVVTSIR
jgi:hypothetical protein